MDCKVLYYGKFNEYNYIVSVEGQECSCSNCVLWMGSVGSEDSFGLFIFRNLNYWCFWND